LDYSVSFKQYIEYLGFDFDTTIETSADDGIFADLSMTYFLATDREESKLNATPDNTIPLTVGLQCTL